ADVDFFGPFGDGVENDLFGIEIVAALVHIAELDGLTDLDGPGVGLLLANDHAEERRFTGTVRADNADNGSGRHCEVHVLKEKPIAKALRETFDLDHLGAQSRARRDADFIWIALLVFGLGDEIVEGVDACLALGLTGLLRRADPFKFARDL